MKDADTVELVTISVTGTVSYQGTTLVCGRPSEFTGTTYESAERFDWSQIPPATPVLDLREVPFEDVLSALFGPTSIDATINPYPQPYRHIPAIERFEEYVRRGAPRRTARYYYAPGTYYCDRPDHNCDACNDTHDARSEPIPCTGDRNS